MDLIKLHRKSVEDFDRRIAEVGEDQWHEPTPCAEWDVKALVNHVVNEDLWTAPLLGGSTVEEVGDRFDGDVLGADPKGAWTAASQKALEAAAGTDLDSLVNVSWGQIPASEYLSQLLLDHTIHGWDLSKGASKDDTIDPELVDACWAICQAGADAIRGSGAFGDDLSVPEEAPLQTRLLAFLGRQA